MKNQLRVWGTLLAMTAVSVQAECRAPSQLENTEILYSVMATVNSPASDYQLGTGLLYTGQYGNDNRFRYVEAEEPTSPNVGEYQYTSLGNVGIVSGHFITSQQDRLPFTITLMCRTDASGIFNYSVRNNELAPATMGRYLLQ
ncbi:MAG: hypothetical protein AAGA91_18050 [Pseudomonadota bacterium]